MSSVFTCTFDSDEVAHPHVHGEIGVSEPRDMRRKAPQRAVARGFGTSAIPPPTSSPSVLPNAPRAERLKGSKLRLQQQKGKKTERQ